MRLVGSAEIRILVILGILMAMTRYHHFGDALHLPDASLAVFFISGFFLSSALIFPALLLEAGLIDFFAVMFGGVSDWCVTPAYWFLIPTYGVLWLGGKWLQRNVKNSRHLFLFFLFTSAVTTSTAFIISNTSFYFFSGKFFDLRFSEYIDRVIHYYPAYAFSGFLYLSIAASVYAVMIIMNRRIKSGA